MDPKRFAECPGFVGGDAPAPGRSGRVVVDPRFTMEARDWLRRRFILNPSLSLDTNVDGIVFEIAARQTPCGPGVRKRKPAEIWPRQEQFLLQLER